MVAASNSAAYGAGLSVFPVLAAIIGGFALLNRETVTQTTKQIADKLTADTPNEALLNSIAGKWTSLYKKVETFNTLVENFKGVKEAKPEEDKGDDNN